MSDLSDPAARFFALHGFTGEGADFSALSSLVGGTWICPDLPGHGIFCDATAEDFSLERMRDRLFPQEERGLIGVGYSMGGRLLLHFATEYPSLFDKLILISTSPGLESEKERAIRRESDKKWIQLLKEEPIGSFFDQWWDQPILQSLRNLPKADRNHLLARRLDQSPQGLIRSLQHHGTGALPSLWRQCSGLTIPTLICVGQNDTKFREIGQRMAAIIPKTQSAVIPDAGHSPHLETPPALSTALRNFLTDA